MFKTWLVSLRAWMLALVFMVGSLPVSTPLAVAARPARALVPAISATQPNVLHPLRVTRTQSSSALSAVNGGGTLTVTYSVYNALAPLTPRAQNSALTVTDTLAALAAQSDQDDAHTVRNALLTDVLGAGVTLLSAQPNPAMRGQDLQIDLGDVPPLGSVTTTLVLRINVSAADLVPLDSGARAFGMMQGRPVEAVAPALLLAGDALAQYLRRTPDADTYDAFMLRALAELGTDPLTAFNFVRAMPHESYPGSLRGTRGTLWSAAGNSADKTSLLIALLRAGGTPARYRHGTLSPASTALLLQRMFPPIAAREGLVDAGTPVANPLADPALLGESGDHWWAEAWLNGAWVDLDPLFADSAQGQVYAANIAADGSDHSAELPDSVRHKVTLRLKVEQFNQISRLSYHYPLSATLNSVALVGNPVGLEHVVTINNQNGAVFGTTIKDYLPYFVIGDDAIGGTQFRDLATNFPLASTVHLAEWLEVELRSPTGKTEAFTRDIVDLIGPAVRANGGDVQATLSASAALVDGASQFRMLFAPSAVPASALDANYDALRKFGREAQARKAAVDAVIASGTRSPQQIAEVSQANGFFRAGARAALGTQVLQFAATSDFGTRMLERAFHTRAYFDAPRIIIAAREARDKDTLILDLVRNTPRVTPYPGQTRKGMIGFNIAWGLAQAELEHGLMQTWYGRAPRSVPRVFDAARAQNVPTVLISVGQIGLLNKLTISANAKTRISEDLLRDPKNMVAVPYDPVNIDGAFTTGWYVFNTDSGVTQDVMEDGTHAAAIEYSLMISTNLTDWPFAIVGFFQGASATTLLFIGYLLGNVPVQNGDIKGAMTSALTAATARANALADEMEERFGGGEAGDKIDCYINGCSFTFQFEATFTWEEFGHTYEKTETYHPPLGFHGGINFASEWIGNRIDPPLSNAMVGSVNVEVTPPAWVTTTLSPPASHTGSAFSISTSTSGVRMQNAASYAAPFDALAVAGSQNGLAAFAAAASGTAPARWLIGPHSGMTLAGANITPDQTVALSGVTGSHTLAANSSASDTLSLSGNGQFFAIGAAPGVIAVSPDQAFTINTSLLANTAGNHQLAVYAPPGWMISIDSAGQITGRVPRGLATGRHTLLVAAQSRADAQLFATTRVYIDVGAAPATVIAVLPDPFHTVQLGPLAADGFPEGVNNGQLQLPNAAYNVVITPGLALAQNFSLSVQGLPAGWAHLSTPVIATDGEVVRVGLYVSPSLPLPPVGSQFPFTVNATGGAWSGAASAVFVLPAVAYAHLQARPLVVYAAPGGSVSSTLSLRNVGNTAGVFPITVSVPAGALHTAPGSLSVSPGATATHLMQVSNLNGPLFSRHNLIPETRSLDYQQRTLIHAFLVPAQSVCLLNAAQLFIDDAPSLTAAMHAAGEAAAQLAVTPTDAALRAQLAAHLQSAAGAALTRALGDALATASVAIGAHSNPADVQADLGTLCLALTEAEAQLALLERFGSSVSFVPGATALLVNQPAELQLEVRNRGTQTNTISVTLALPAGLVTPTLVTLTLAPAASSSLAVTVSLPSAGPATLSANAVALSGTLPSPFVARATAGLQAVETALRVLLVQPAPAFVEQAIGSTRITAKLSNSAGWPSAGSAQLLLIAPNGNPVVTRTQPVTVSLLDSLNTLDFGVINTSGYLSGVYTASVSVVLSTPAAFAALAPATGYGLLTVGQGLLVSASASPLLLAPGDAIITTVLRTERTQAFGGGGPLEPTPLQTSTLLVTATLHSGASDPTRGLSLTLPAGVHDIVIEDGAYQIGVLGRWFSSLRASVYYTTSEARQLWLAHGADHYYGGSPTREEALALNQGANGRLHLSDPATLYLWLPDADNNKTNNSGALTVNIRTRSGPDNSLNRRVEGALSLGLPRQMAETLAFDNFAKDNSCLACHVQGQTLFGARAAQQKFQRNVVDPRMMDVLRAAYVGATDAQGEVQNGSAGADGQTMFGLWAVSQDAPRPEAPPVPELRPPGLRRYEEVNPDLRYNGAPYYQSPAWIRFTDGRWSSGGIAYNDTSQDSVSLAFTGTWVGLGLIGSTNSAIIDVLIDGVARESIDAYRHDDMPISRYYTATGSGPHTIIARNSGQRNPLASLTRMHFDFFDTWDGTPLPTGSFAANSERVLRSNNWTQDVSALAYNGSYLRDGTSVWFPFDGDSFALELLSTSWAGSMHVLVDGAHVAYVSATTDAAMTRTLSYAGFGPGPHMAHVLDYRGRPLVNAFSAPGRAPFETPGASGLRRHEENDLAIKLNGVPYSQTRNTWIEGASAEWSGGYGAYSRSAGDWASFTFTGSWVNLVLAGGSDRGIAEIFIDGASQGSIDTYRRNFGDGVSRAFGGLSAGPHVISVSVLGTQNPNANNNYIVIDAFDVWDGSSVMQGRFEESAANVYFSNGTRDAFVVNGVPGLMRDFNSAWALFTGDSVSFDAFAANWAGDVEVFIDNQPRAVLDLYRSTPTTHTISFDGLGSGPHELRIENYRGRSTFDALRAPGSAPYFTPTINAIQRYEEDTDLWRYNGNAMRVMPRQFNNPGKNAASDGYTAESRTMGDRFSTTFSGTWAALGLFTAQYAGIVMLSLDGGVPITIDLYTAGEGVTTTYFTGLSAITHTLELSVTGSRNVSSTDNWVAVDYLDVWNGGSLAGGQIEDNNARVIVSGRATTANDVRFSGATYLRDFDAAWFPFTGDEVTLGLLGDSWMGALDVSIDGGTSTIITLNYASLITFTRSFSGLGTGPHVMLVKPNSGRATLDYFSTPVMALARAASTLVEAETISRHDLAQPEVLTEQALGQGPASALAALAPLTPSHALSTDSTQSALVRMADFLLTRRRPDFTWSTSASGGRPDMLWWFHDEPSNGYSPALSAYTVNGLANMYAQTGNIAYRDAVTRAAMSMAGWPYTVTTSTPIHILIGMNAARPYLADSAQRALVESRMISVSTYLRGLQNADGGWGKSAVISASDPLPTAGALYALSLLQPTSIDPALINATEYLLRVQRSDGQWPSVFEANNNRPILTTTWVDIALPYVYEVLSSYSVNIDHHVPVTHVTALTPTASSPPAVSVLPGALGLVWQYNQPPSEQAHPTSFGALLTQLQPGEVRAVSAGTRVTYAIESGINSVTLPPLFVSVAHIVALSPADKALAPGSTLTLSIVLSNPTASSSVYTLDVAGLPGDWARWPLTVSIAANSSISVPLAIDTPRDATDWRGLLQVIARTSSNGVDSALATVSVVEPFTLQLTPAIIEAEPQTTVTYTLIAHNPAQLTRTLTLSLDGYAIGAHGLPASVLLGPGASTMLPFSVLAQGPSQAARIGVQAVDAANAISRTADAMLAITGRRGVAAALTPASAVIGQSSGIWLQAIISNTGSLSDVYALTLTAPAGWQLWFEANTSPVLDAALPWGSRALRVWVNPANASAAGTYPLSLTATSRHDASVQAVAQALVSVGAADVQAGWLPTQQSAVAGASTAWTLRITNTGDVALIYDIAGAGVLAPFTLFAQNQVTLAAGAVADIAASVLPPSSTAPGPLQLLAVVSATNVSGVAAVAAALLDVLPVAGASSNVTPTQIVTAALTPGHYALWIENTGNRDETYVLNPQPGSAALTISIERTSVTLPPGGRSVVLLDAQASAAGAYPFTIEVIAQSNGQTQFPGARLDIPGATATPTPTATPIATPTATPTATRSRISLPVVVRGG